MPKMSPAFLQAYQGLNLEQRTAVDTLDGPVMVIAGPGTGKTQILATRIANLLIKTDTNPSSILALTFTESGAQAMKKRLISLIGETAYSVQIQTFHSFCTEVIASHPEFFSLAQDAEPLSDLDRYQLFEKLILSSSLTSIKPINAPLLYLRSVMSGIQNLKREGITPEIYHKILDQESKIIETEGQSWKKVEINRRTKSLQKNWELLSLYEKYQYSLAEIGRYDFEDMIAFVREAFQKQELLLLEYQERLQYFLIDEYQDTNSAQNQVLELLASYWGADANIFVVGDPDQSIYRFQGASLENTFHFLKAYPAATVITLTQNYRSTQPILDVAREVINHQEVDIELPVELSQRLQSQSKVQDKLTLFVASSVTLEHVFIAEQVRELILSGVSASEIAIIYRNNAESQPIADVLSRWGIQYDIEGGSDVLKHPTITQLLTLLTVLRDIRTQSEDINLFTLLNYSWLKLHPLSILRVVRLASELKQPLYTTLTSPTTLETFQATLSAEDKILLKNVVNFATKLGYWSGLDAQLTFPAWFETVINESGFLPELLHRTDVIEQLNILNTFFTEIKRLSSHDHTLHLQEFLSLIQTMIDHGLQLPEQDLNLRQNTVRLVTAHKSKGQEWEYVFVTGLIDKKWGNSSLKELIPLPEGILEHTKTTKESRLDDDRRLFYVALTRAKKKLYVSYSQTTQSGGNTKEQTPSIFIEEIPKNLLKKEESFESRQDLQTLLSRLLQSSVQVPPQTPSEKEFLAGMIEKYKLSATGLNVYLECPYKFKLEVLLRVPRTKATHLSFGTAIHAALEFLFKSLMENKNLPPTLDQVLNHFHLSLKKELLTPEDFAIRLAQGHTLLKGYYQEYLPEFVVPLFVERSFGRGFSQPHLGDIPLSGKIDKIEWLDPTERTVKVVDYKTGRPRTKNEIEGKTQNSDGSYKRQLVFYKLLADLDRSFKLTVEHAEFDFIQPKTDGTYVKHTFSISPLEVEELKVMIKEVMTKIREQHFPKTTNYHVCESCHFITHCWPEGIQ